MSRCLHCNTIHNYEHQHFTRQFMYVGICLYCITFSYYVKKNYKNTGIIRYVHLHSCFFLSYSLQNTPRIFSQISIAHTRIFIFSTEKKKIPQQQKTKRFRGGCVKWRCGRDTLCGGDALSKFKHPIIKVNYSFSL